MGVRLYSTLGGTVGYTVRTSRPSRSSLRRFRVSIRRLIVAATPLHRLATVADVANTARWLASPAASYVTGKIIEIDGGGEASVFPDDTPDLRPANRQ